jgi:hypothetical protein
VLFGLANNPLSLSRCLLLGFFDLWGILQA